MSNLCLVTGANGHLGNNLVRTLLDKGEIVRAGVRNTQDIGMFEGLECDIVYTEMQDAFSMEKALEGVDVLYHVAAVFKHWAKNPNTDIIEPNLIGTEIVLAAAAKAKVRQIIYVSSVAAIGHNGLPLNESHWNQESENAYYKSKILSEKKAWELAKKYNLSLICVQPSAMIGPNTSKLTDTMKFIDSIQKKSLFFNPNFHFNFVDVRDVAEGIYAASKKGASGQRYILANQRSSSLKDIIEAANQVNPSYKVLPTLPKILLLVAAKIMELVAKLTGKPAELISSQVKLFHNVKQEYDISKARSELNYAPRSPMQTLVETFQYLEKK